MNKKREKMNLFYVGVAPQGDPHKTINKPNVNGITLIALIITIIVMLILVGVTVNIAINGGLFKTAKQAVEDTQLEADKESLLSSVIGSMNSRAEIDFTELDANLPGGFTGSDGTYTSKSGNMFYVSKNGDITTPTQVTIGEKTVTLTPDNVAEYLGKVVTNYKTDYNTTESITIGEEEYTVSTKYRLYYVDFANKYQDGPGTIYLKADCISNKYVLPTTAPSEGDVVKIKELNPELYREGVTPPNEDNSNMKVVTWLTNTNNWAGLKAGVNQKVGSNINYVVGAPSLEMMMDSYNTHYKLVGDVPDTTTKLEGTNERVKLFYKYPYGNKKYGYGVGPLNDSSALNGYGTRTSYPSVKTDTAIDSMYFPGDNRAYYLSSPSDRYVQYLVYVSSPNGGYVGAHSAINEQGNYGCGICPLVSLKSGVKLELAD